jgi:uncharacterized membrane protein
VARPEGSATFRALVKTPERAFLFIFDFTGAFEDEDEDELNPNGERHAPPDRAVILALKNLLIFRRRSFGYVARMEKNRLEAFSDGVIAIIITIMVLELHVPHATELAALRELLPVFLSYVLSFIYVGIYWNNHHHMFQAVKQVRGGILWANLHLLFWLSLFPFATAWVGENHLAATPVAIYGLVLLMAAVAYKILQQTIIRSQGKDSVLAHAVGGDWKGRVSPLCYLAAIPLAFLKDNVWIAIGLYVFVAALWFVPDRRIERVLKNNEANEA